MENKKEEYDYINPAHYKIGGFETFDIMVQVWGAEKAIAHCEMTAFKYRMRAGKKPGTTIEQDLQKAAWYEAKIVELCGAQNLIKDLSNGDSWTKKDSMLENLSVNQKLINKSHFFANIRIPEPKLDPVDPNQLEIPFPAEEDKSEIKPGGYSAGNETKWLITPKSNRQIGSSGFVGHKMLSQAMDFVFPAEEDEPLHHGIDGREELFTPSKKKYSYDTEFDKLRSKNFRECGECEELTGTVLWGERKDVFIRNKEVILSCLRGGESISANGHDFNPIKRRSYPRAEDIQSISFERQILDALKELPKEMMSWTVEQLKDYLPHMISTEEMTFDEYREHLKTFSGKEEDDIEKRRKVIKDDLEVEQLTGEVLTGKKREAFLDNPDWILSKLRAGGTVIIKQLKFGKKEHVFKPKQNNP